MAHDPAPHRIAAPESLREQAERSVSSRIVTGEFRPGQVLTVPSLAADFGVSATPVREALLTLVRRGFLAPVRNKGFRVTEVTADELQEITAVRRMLEVPPMRVVAGRVDEVRAAELARLAATIESAFETRDFEAYLAADAAFHLCILEIAGNRRLVELVADLRTQTRLVGLVEGDVEALRDSVHEHAELLRALVDGDGEAAAAVMDRHLDHIAGVWSGAPEDEVA